MFTKFLKPSHQFIFNTPSAGVSHAIKTEKNDRLKGSIILFAGIITICSLMAPSLSFFLKDTMAAGFSSGQECNRSVAMKDTVIIPDNEVPAKELIFKSQCQSPIWLMETPANFVKKAICIKTSARQLLKREKKEECITKVCYLRSNNKQVFTCGKRELCFTELCNINSLAVIKGFVRDDKGKPVSGAMVLLYKDADITGKIMTDYSGGFVFINVEPDLYILKVNSDGYESYEHPAIEITPNNTFYFNIDIRNEQNLITSCTFRSRYSKGLFIPYIKVYITDEKNKIIEEPVIWKYKRPYDSIRLGRESMNDSIMNNYNFTTNNFTCNYPDKWLMIKAKGYADVIIRNIQLSDPNQKRPVLYIKMYPRQYLKKGDLYTLINTFVYDNVNVKDSMQLDFKYYTEKILNLSVGHDNSFFIVKTYPNPVKDKLFIDLNTSIIKPYLARLMDINGKLISETELSTQHSVLDMEWQAAGVYFIQVYDPLGSLLYAFKFIKT